MKSHDKLIHTLIRSMCYLPHVSDHFVHGLSGTGFPSECFENAGGGVRTLDVDASMERETGRDSSLGQFVSGNRTRRPASVEKFPHEMVTGRHTTFFLFINLFVAQVIVYGA